MTRDEHRAKCFEAMEEAYEDALHSDSNSIRDTLIAIFDSLHGIAFINPIEATEKMIAHGAAGATCRGHPVVYIFAAMSAAGDLTNPPELKP